MAKSREAFRTISEVSDWLETPAHVLRFWESRFNQIKPVKRAGGRRYYRPADMRLLGGVKRLLHDDGLTIKGVQKILREKGVKHVTGLCLEPLPDEDGKHETAAQTTQADTAADEFEKPVRWIDPLASDEDKISENQQVTPDQGDQEPRRFGFIPDSESARETAQPTPASTNGDLAADNLIRQQADRSKQQDQQPIEKVADEIDAQTSDQRIVALYRRLQALRDRVASEIQAG